jgi:hypothetical protein
MASAAIAARSCTSLRTAVAHGPRSGRDRGSSGSDVPSGNSVANTDRYFTQTFEKIIWIWSL